MINIIENYDVLILEMRPIPTYYCYTQNIP